MPTRLPEHPVEATLHPGNLDWTLHMHRVFPQDQAAVWDAITKADLVGRWMPFRPAGDLVEPGDVWLTPIDDGQDVQGRVLEVIPPSSLRYLWVADELRFRVEPEGDGALLHLAHTFEDRNSAADLAAGWHLRLGALELLLAGAEIPSPLAPDDVRGDLKRAYEALFADNDSTPAPMGEL